jgi:hypothetical protein
MFLSGTSFLMKKLKIKMENDPVVAGKNLKIILELKIVNLEFRMGIWNLEY